MLQGDQKEQMEEQGLREEKRTRTEKKRESKSGIGEREGTDVGWDLQVRDLSV